MNNILYFFSEFHEIKTRVFLHDFLYYFPNSTLLDAGAYLGDTSIRLAEKHTNSTILAIEPNKDNCKFIKQQSKNKNLKNLQLYNCGLSDTDKKCLSCDYHSFRSDKVYKESLVGIKTKTIDYFYGKYPALSLIHLDVETYEYMCIKGCKKIINDKKPMFIIELLKSNKDKDKIQLFFRKHGYREFFIPESVSLFGAKGYNHVFCHTTNPYTQFIDVCLNKCLIKPV